MTEEPTAAIIESSLKKRYVRYVYSFLIGGGAKLTSLDVFSYLAKKTCHKKKSNKILSAER